MVTLVLAFQIAGGIPAAEPADSALMSIANFLRISEQLATGGQPTAEDIDAIADRGFDVVINLATAHPERNAHEGFAVAERGMTYVNIPVPWEEPTLRDLEMFISVMEANRDRKVFVHCQANYRASAFTYLYRTLSAGIDDTEAKRAMEVIWDPHGDDRWPQWGAFVQQAKDELGHNP